MMERTFGQTRFRVLRDDIVTQRVHAIVNAANVTLLGGGGVDGAIHRAAGPELLAACRAMAEITPGVRLRPCQAVLTSGFNLPARHVIHCAAPIFSHCESPLEAHRLLAANYSACLQLAERQGLRTLAFPALGCGVYGFSHADSSTHALAAMVARALEPGCGLDEVRMVLFSEDAAAAWRLSLSRIQPMS